MEAKDFYLAPIYLMLIYGIAIFIRNKYYSDSLLKKYFIPGLTVKLLGSFASALVYWYYYKDGDTIHYFDKVKQLHFLFTLNAAKFWKIVFANTKVYDPEIYGNLMSIRAWDTSAFMVVRFASILSIPTFCTYLEIALLFAALSFSGIWKMLEAFCDINPKLTKEFAIACLFIPSVFFWGSGLFKDTLALGFVGWFTHSIYMVFIKRKKIVPHIIILIIAFNILFILKAYIIMAFLPSLLFWIFFKYRSRIKNDFIRKIMTPLIICISVLGAYFSITEMGGKGDTWSLDQISTRSKDMQWWHKEVKKIYGDSGGGSYYSIGNGDFSMGNIIRSFPLAVNVTLFRPYLWEIHSPIMLLSAIESLIMFFFTVKIIREVGLPKLFLISTANPEVFFSLLFTIIFAFAVGFSSFNFGALVRYKIPCIPFYVMALFMIRYHANILKNKEELAPVE